MNKDLFQSVLQRKQRKLNNFHILTLKYSRNYSDNVPKDIDQEMPPMGGFPGLSNKNDMFREKQAYMKKQHQKEFQSYMQQNQNVDARKQKIQRQRQPTQDTGGFHSSQMDKSQKLSQMADEVFNEVLGNRSNGLFIPQQNFHSKISKLNLDEHPPQSVAQPEQNNFMFGGSEEDEKRKKKMEKLEYGKMLRNQMGSAKGGSRHPRQEENTYAPIIEQIGQNYQQNASKIDKNEYRLDLQRQIEERKQTEQRRKFELEQEDFNYQRNLNGVQQPGASVERTSSSYSQNRPISSNESNQYVRQASITQPNEETPEQIAKKLQYQSELRAQIMEKERQKQLEKNREREMEEIEERKKHEEQIQLKYQFCKEEGLPVPDTQGRPLDLNNRKKYFEPSTNNPIPSSGIKKAMEKSYVNPQQQFQKMQYNNVPQSMESDRTNPSTIRHPAPNYYEPQMQNQQFSQPRPIEPHYYQDAPSHAQFSQPPTPNSMMQMQEAPPHVNIMIEEQKKVIEMYQHTLQQIMEFQKVMKDTNQAVASSGQGMCNTSNSSFLEVFSPSPVKIQPKYQPKPNNPEVQHCR